MKPAEIIKNIEKKGNLKDPNIGILTDWIIDNLGKNNFQEFVSAINEDEIITVTPEGKKEGKLFFTKLRYSSFFNGLAIKYTHKGWYEESKIIFETILKRTPNEVNSLNDFGTSLLHKIETLYRLNAKIDKKELDKSRKLIFKAYRYDKKVHEDWRDKPSYKNLCYLRAIESIFYYNMKDSFTSFVLAWMSIEMSLYRIWYQYLIQDDKIGKKSKLKDLMRWDTDYILQTLCLNNFSAIVKIKNDLDTLKGLRNKLFHGDIDNPSTGQTKHCLETALKLTHIFVN